MDFGDILDEWDKLTAIHQPQKIKKNKPPLSKETPNTQKTTDKPPPKKSTSKKDIHPLTTWLETNEVYDKDATPHERMIKAQELISKQSYKETVPNPPNSHTKPRKPSVHPLTKWLASNEIYNKDADLRLEEVSPQERRYCLLNKKIDAFIDLHGLTQDEAWNALENFFQESRNKKLEKLLIIHGKGNHSTGGAVLKHIVRKFIERCPFAGESGYGNSNSGGTGATWVFLKENK